MLYKNKSHLIQEYVTNRKSAREVAELLGCKDHKTIIRWLRIHGIKVRGKHIRTSPATVEVKCDYCKKPISKYRSIVHKRNYCSYECMSRWMVGNTRGENSYNWKGGITAISSNNLKTIEFQTLRKEVLVRFPLCVICGDTNRLHIHHIKTRAKNPELVFEKDNLITICIHCHSKIKGKEHFWEQYFTRLISKSGELLGHPNGNAEGNQQPSQPNVIDIVGWKAQRLTGEEITTNKPDTSAAPERDDIVRAYRKL